MKTLTPDSLSVFGLEVKTFSQDIDEAFDLIKISGDTAGKKNYYAVSSMNKKV